MHPEIRIAQKKFSDGNKFVWIEEMLLCFRLELNGHRRRLTWEATPRSIHEGVASAILNSDCLVFDTSIAQLFAENGNLGINVTISMVSYRYSPKFTMKKDDDLGYDASNAKSIFFNLL